MEKLSVVAIGGGSPSKVSKYLERAVEMTGIEHGAHVLVIPTALTPAEQKYPEKFERHVNQARQLYAGQLNLPMDVLHGYDAMPALEELREKIEWADVAYITGGKSEHMMREWKKYGIDRLLTVRALGGSGLVLSGISAGAIAPFAWGQADPFSDSNAKMGEFVEVDGLGLIHATVGPHFDKLQDGHDYRRQDYLSMLAKNYQTRKLKYGFGIDSNAAVIVRNGAITAHGLKDNGVTVIRAHSDGVTTEKMSASDAIALKDL